ncbi:hypothetical protein D3C80_1108810 [compost metagenome]
MIRDFLIDVAVSLFFAYVWLIGKGSSANVLIEAVPGGITVVIGFVGADSMLVPFRCEHTFTADRLKTFSDSTNPRKQVDKTEGGLTFRALGQKRLQVHELPVGKPRDSFALHPPIHGFSAMCRANLIQL